MHYKYRNTDRSILHPSYVCTKRRKQTPAPHLSLSSQNLTQFLPNLILPQHISSHILTMPLLESCNQKSKRPKLVFSKGRIASKKVLDLGQDRPVEQLILELRVQPGLEPDSQWWQMFNQMAAESEDYLSFFSKKYKKWYDMAFQQAHQKAVILSVLKNRLPIFKNNEPQILSRLLLTFRINPMNDMGLITWPQFNHIIKVLLNHCNHLKFLINFILATKQTRTVTLKEFKQLIKLITSKVDRRLHPNELPLNEQACDTMALCEQDNFLLGQQELRKAFKRSSVKIKDFVRLIIDQF